MHYGILGAGSMPALTTDGIELFSLSPVVRMPLDIVLPRFASFWQLVEVDFCSFFGGNGKRHAWDIKVDGDSHMTLFLLMYSGDLPLKNEMKAMIEGGYDQYLARVEGDLFLTGGVHSSAVALESVQQITRSIDVVYDITDNTMDVPMAPAVAEGLRLYPNPFLSASGGRLHIGLPATLRTKTEELTFLVHDLSAPAKPRPRCCC